MAERRMHRVCVYIDAEHIQQELTKTQLQTITASLEAGIESLGAAAEATETVPELHNMVCSAVVYLGYVVVTPADRALINAVNKQVR